MSDHPPPDTSRPALSTLDGFTDLVKAINHFGVVCFDQQYSAREPLSVLVFEKRVVIFVPVI